MAMEPARENEVAEQTYHTLELEDEAYDATMMESLAAESAPATPVPPTPPIPPNSPNPPLESEDDKDGLGATVVEEIVSSAKNSGPPTKAETMVALAKGFAKFFHTAEGDAYASIAVENHIENVKVRSKFFRQWLGRLYYQDAGKPVGGAAIKDAVEALEAEGRYDGPELPLHIRYAWFQGAIFIDLCNKTWDQVMVSKNGWQIIGSAESPVKFLRAQGMGPLPIPVQGGSIDLLRKYLNIENESDWVMIVSWLVGSMRPSGPFAGLVLQGEQGTSKTFTAKLLRDLVDPSSVPSQSLPRSERDLVIAADKSWVLNFDNLSYLSAQISDALCRLSTGGGFRTRALYTDDGERLFNNVRPIIMNGISDIATRHDLADRCIVILLPTIPKDKRRPEKELNMYWELTKDKLFGALCSALVVALANIESVKFPYLPRMADFAAWASAAETAFGWAPGTFMREYENNQRSLVQIALEADPVAVGVIRLVHKHPDHEWHGSASSLKRILEADQELAYQKNWPRSANVLSGRLRRAAASLREIGIDITWTKSGKREIHIVPTEAFKFDTESPEYRAAERQKVPELPEGRNYDDQPL